MNDEHGLARGPHHTGWARLRDRHVARRARRELVRELPDAIGLFAVAVTSGLTVRLAVAAVARHLPPARVHRGLLEVESRIATGMRLADALDLFAAQLGEPVRPLAHALSDAERYGTPIESGLLRAADDARRAYQRDAEEAARRLPVVLLFPLVLCILPAFGLLTLTPLIAGGIRAIGL